MKLAEATARFLDNPSRVSPAHIGNVTHAQALFSLTSYFSSDTKLTDITSSGMRDFLSRWYVEISPVSKSIDLKSVDLVPEPLDMLASLEEFFAWVDQQTVSNQATEILSILNELRQSLPRAVEINRALTNALRELGGSFSFPEFLTSFEEGGSSQYDIDVPGNIGAVDGYFRIVRVEGLSVEAEELISEERIWPIAFPREVATLLEPGYIINLELVRKAGGWEIAECGFAYPPGTKF